MQSQAPDGNSPKTSLSPNIVLGIRKLSADNPHLECDGMTTVLSWFLTQNGVKHCRVFGSLTGANRQSIIHWWIRLERPEDRHTLEYVDCRVGMWIAGVGETDVVFPYKENRFLYYTHADHPAIESPLLPSILTQKIIRDPNEPVR